jgi:peroxiredoxin
MRVGLLATVAVLLCLGGCAPGGLAPVGQSRKPAPDFSLPTTGGQRIVLSSLKGKVVVVDFWATWCDSCPQALAHLQLMAGDPAMARQGLITVPINEQENTKAARAFVDANHFTLDVALDSDGSIATSYGIISLPTTIVIGRDGLVWAVIPGWTQDTPTQIDQALAGALNAPVP